MSEVEKMYENVGIKPIKQGYCDWDSDCPYPDIINNGCGDECPYWKYEDEAEYPPFTAEKQIELIKLLASYGKYDQTKRLLLECIDGEWYIAFYEDMDLMSNGSEVDFKECLAKVINKLWQDLTAEEKQQVKGILG